MGYFEANGLQFDPLPAGVSPTALTQGKYHDTGAFGPAPVASKPLFEDKSVTFPAVDGVTDVRHGFRGRLIFATLVLAGPLSYVEAQCKTVLDTLSQNARYTISLPEGTSYDGCKILDCGQPSFVNMSGGVLLVIPCIFIQKSTTN